MLKLLFQDRGETGHSPGAERCAAQEMEKPKADEYETLGLGFRGLGFFRSFLELHGFRVYGLGFSIPDLARGALGVYDHV